MELFRIAKSYLRQAEARLRDAKDALLEENYPYAARLSQECVELFLKASLRAIGIEYPKVHDVSDILIKAKIGFQSGLEAKWIFYATHLGY